MAIMNFINVDCGPGKTGMTRGSRFSYGTIFMSLILYNKRSLIRILWIRINLATQGMSLAKTICVEASYIFK